MSKLMLIDSTHPEETRVAVVSNGQIEDFDFEARAKRQLRGNIYLAKVTRVEPSLQAAFVDYGGNRHGFLAFGEIHPDYYQIPKEDREALMAEAAEEEERVKARESRRRRSQPARAPAPEVITAEIEAEIEDVVGEDHAGDDHAEDADHIEDADADADDAGEMSDEFAADVEGEDDSEDDAEGLADADEADSHGATIFAADAGEEADAPVAAPAAADVSSEDDDDDDDDEEQEATVRRRAAIFQRKYRIQEVIRRRQVLLVQVVKEERGNKGAALTTYLSLAGRYCVLMPNTARAGGVSRKITNASDRKRLKSIMSELDIPRGAGLIVRTAGAKRTRTEITRDFDYLTTLWKQIVGRTIESTAPSLIHEEGHLVLRAVRDLYDKDVEQIIVDGAEAFNEARSFVEMLMPSHARKVVRHEGGPPLFVMSGVEHQLETIFSPIVQLPSGGYIVINQTEALVAVDVNSGKATRERNVESTALKTNLEAASEVCRQMRLRDLAGLIVIDFIDMEDNKNNRAVERRMADSLKIDRARVQTGRISQFGLFEISRQRRRAGVLELSSEPCPHCASTGRVRSTESAAIQVLRMIEARAADDRVDQVLAQAAPDVALYILNEKRSSIAVIEAANSVTVRIEANNELKAGDCELESRADGQPVAYKPVSASELAKLKPRPMAPPGEFDEGDDDETIEDDGDEEATTASDDDDDDGRSRRGRSRRGGRRRRGNGSERESESGAEAVFEGGDDASEEVQKPRDRESNRESNRDSGRARDGGRDRDRDRDSRGRRRRRGGRENAPRVPDIALDGGEMLDAIASVAFLVARTAGAEETEDADGTAPDAAMPPAAVSAQEAVASTPAAREPVASAPVAADPVARAPAPATAEPTFAAEPEATEANSAAEARLHPIHGVTSDGDPPKEDKPRRMGWWNKKKTG
jgi:ribonuclease E